MIRKKKQKQTLACGMQPDVIQFVLSSVYSLVVAQFVFFRDANTSYTLSKTPVFRNDCIADSFPGSLFRKWKDLGNEAVASLKFVIGL